MTDKKGLYTDFVISIFFINKILNVSEHLENKLYLIHLDGVEKKYLEEIETNLLEKVLDDKLLAKKTCSTNKIWTIVKSDPNDKDKLLMASKVKISSKSDQLNDVNTWVKNINEVIKNKNIDIRVIEPELEEYHLNLNDIASKYVSKMKIIESKDSLTKNIKKENKLVKIYKI